ncbi:type IV pilus assembly protein PilE [Alteromonadaceae bacterium Bs31]|nr:type IV pilus assembly protein PilE [Alteromonadaceae bacterium Bs31]
MLNTRGFSLVEVVIVMAIIGIVTAFAYPSYQDSVLKSHRAEGIETLLDVAQAQEVLYSQTNAYSTNAKPFAPTASSVTSEKGYYVVTVTSGACGTSACFVATATAQGSQAADKLCATLSIDNLGTKSSTPSGNSCW